MSDNTVTILENCESMDITAEQAEQLTEAGLIYPQDGEGSTFYRLVDGVSWEQVEAFI
jgi:hypothetical protein